MIELGLQRIARLLSNTPLSWRAVHVAGTNGKGSICAYISAMLDVYNKSELRQRNKDPPIRHGRFNSPHLVDRWDCTTINQDIVPFTTFHKAEERMLTRDKEESIAASEFELLTATAFEIFQQENLDVGVVEVGMGGRLDATNVIGIPSKSVSRASPLVTAISNIGLDHQDFLGSTLEEIAYQKAGIIKPSVPVIYDESNDSSAVQVLQNVATENQSRIYSTKLNVTAPRAYPWEIFFFFDHMLRNSELSFDVSTPAHVRNNFVVAFLTAWTALWQLNRLPLSRRDRNVELRDLAKEMQDVINTTTFPGRQQRISIEQLTGRKENILLDGAHNAQSALALASAVEKLRRARGKGNKVTWVLAASSSKDVSQILSPLLKDGDVVFATEFGTVDGMPWVKPLPSSRLLQAAKAVVSEPESLSLEDYGSDILSALNAASQRAAEGPLIVAGSLYLVGEVLRLLRDR